MRSVFIILSALAVIVAATAEPAAPQPGQTSHSSLEKRARAYDNCAYLNTNDSQLGQLNGVYCQSGVKAYIEYKFPNATTKRKRELRQRLQLLIAQNGQTCIYPRNATPQPLNDDPCFFTCTKGYSADQTARTCECTTAGRIDCGGKCVRGTACVSGVPVKRELYPRAPLECPRGQRMCGRHTGGKECYDTNSSLENCGGCLYPLTRSESSGRDCTAITGVKDVACVWGQCQITSCMPDYHISANGTMCEYGSKRENIAWPSRDL